MFYPFWRIFAFLALLSFLCLSPGLANPPLVKIGWDSNPEVRVLGYNVYRSTGTNAPALLNQNGLVDEARFVDRAVEKGATYTYLVTAVDLQGLESVYSNPLVVKVEKQVPVPQTAFLPASLATDQAAFKNTFVGLGLLNLGDVPDQVGITGIDCKGAQTGYHTVANIAPHGRTSELPDQVANLPASTAIMLGRSNSDIHPFFLAGTKDLRSFEGITEALHPARTLFFPISLSKTGTASLTLFNPDETKPAEIELTAWDRDGSSRGTHALVLPALGSFQGVLGQLFGPEFSLEEGYVVVSSKQPVEGYEFSAFDSQSLSGVPGEPAYRGERLSLPHFFFDDSGGDTEIHVINADASEVLLEFKAYVDGVPEPEIRTVRLAPRALGVMSMRGLLGREGIPGVATGDLEVTAIGRDGSDAIYAKVVAQATFIGNGGRARAIAPLRAQGAETWIFPAVLQQRDAGFCTGLALLNQRNEALALTVRAIDDQGQLIAERVVEVPGGQRLVGQLDADVFFGPGFSQMGGHLEVTGELSFMALALFGDQWVEFLSQIGPVLR